MFFRNSDASTNDYCLRNCYEKTGHLHGLWIDSRGIIHATKCLKCEAVTIADDPENPFDEVNRKLDLLLGRFGYDV